MDFELILILPLQYADGRSEESATMGERDQQGEILP
jgi:hypothetical protein